MYFNTTMACFKMMTLNCQGLSDREKRSDVLNYLKCKTFDIYLFRIHILPRDSNLVSNPSGDISVSLIISPESLEESHLR